MKVTLAAWAEARYDPPPSIHTLRRWVKDGELHPTPELVGKTYYVDEKARRLSVESTRSGGTLVDRMKADA